VVKLVHLRFTDVLYKVVIYIQTATLYSSALLTLAARGQNGLELLKFLHII
jgi:hypothetical protein